MLVDILVAAGVGFTQLALTWYGVHVSVAENRLRNAFIIGIVGAAGIGLTIYGAIRSGTAQSDLKAQLDTIQKNTQTPPSVVVNPPVVNVNNPPPLTPVRHTALTFLPPNTNAPGGPFLPFRKDQKLALNIGYINSGDFAILESMEDVVVVLADLEESNQNTVFKHNRAKLKPRNSSARIEAHLPAISYHTYGGPTLTEDDVSQLLGGKKLVCVVGVAYWRDDSGRYETDLSQCWLSGDTDWHMGGENNKETKRSH